MNDVVWNLSNRQKINESPLLVQVQFTITCGAKIPVENK